MRSADSFSPLGTGTARIGLTGSGIFGDATEGQAAGETATPSAAVTAGTVLFAVVLMPWALRG